MHRHTCIGSGCESMLSKASLSFAYTNSLGWAPLETRELRGYGGSWDGEGVGAGFQKPCWNHYSLFSHHFQTVKVVSQTIWWCGKASKRPIRAFPKLAGAPFWPAPVLPGHWAAEAGMFFPLLSSYSSSVWHLTLRLSLLNFMWNLFSLTSLVPYPVDFMFC